MNRRIFLTLPLGVSLLMLQGCGISVTSALQLVIAAAEAAIAVVAPEFALIVDPYLKAVSQATSFASTELASADSSAIKAEKIIAEFARIAGPSLPAGIPQTIIAAVQAVVTAVSNFLASIQPAAPPAAQLAASKMTGKGVKPAQVNVPTQIKVSAADRATLTAIKARADALTAKIK